MTELLAREPTVRLAVFGIMLLVMALWEIAAPRRALTLSKRKRWSGNLLLIVVDTLTVRLVLPLTAVQLALTAEQRGAGLLNSFEAPVALEIPLGVLLLDLVIYLQHRLFHVVPLLWRLHAVHHADIDIDVTTGLRFHPLEILISLGIKFATIWLLGASAAAVLLFELILNGAAMFNHANVRLPLAADRLLRLVLVTPDMHRVHHSIIEEETNSNYGFNLPWWDRLFGTYRAQPREGHEKMDIGLAPLRGEQVASLWWILTAPFRSQPK